MSLKIAMRAIQLILLFALCQGAGFGQRNTRTNTPKKPTTIQSTETPTNTPPPNLTTGSIDQTKTLLNYTYFPKGSASTNDPPKLFIRTLAYRLDLSARGIPLSKLRVNIFFEAKLEGNDFEKASDGRFIVKKEPEFFFVHLMNRSDPNLTFDSKKDRLLWFGVGESRWVIGTLDRIAISNFDFHSSSPAPLETITDMLARGGDVTELLTSLELTKNLPQLSERDHIEGHLGDFQFVVGQSLKAALIAFSNSLKTSK